MASTSAARDRAMRVVRCAFTAEFLLRAGCFKPGLEPLSETDAARDYAFIPAKSRKPPLTFDVSAGKRLISMEAVPKSPARIADVAARAGVGIATVSRVVNNRANVAAATQARVLEAISALEYRPSSVARNLSLKQTLVIGVVLPFLTEASPIERVRGVVTALASSPYDLALYDVESADRQQRAFRLLADAHRTDGLLVVSLIPPDEEVRRLRAESIPCVLIDARHDGLPSVADELLRLPEPPTAVFAASDVQALGVLEAARSLGIDVPKQLSVIGFDDIETASYVGLTTVRQRLFESGRRGAELLLQALAG